MPDHLPPGGDAGSPGDVRLLLDAYLDGALSAQDAARFDAALQADAALRDEVELQAQLDASLRRQFEPDVSGLDPLTAPARTLAPRPLWVRYAAIAAILVLGTVATIVNLPRRGPVISPFEGYAAEVRGGMQPYEVCTDDHEFVEYMKREFGEPIGIAPVPGLALIGWGVNQDVMSYETISLLASYSDPAAKEPTPASTPIIVFMDKESRDRRMPKADATLKIHKRELASLVLYEISPFDAPVILPALERR